MWINVEYYSNSCWFFQKEKCDFQTRVKWMNKVVHSFFYLLKSYKTLWLDVCVLFLAETIDKEYNEVFLK